MTMAYQGLERCTGHYYIPERLVDALRLFVPEGCKEETQRMILAGHTCRSKIRRPSKRRKKISKSCSCECLRHGQQWTVFLASLSRPFVPTDRVPLPNTCFPAVGAYSASRTELEDVEDGKI